MIAPQFFINYLKPNNFKHVQSALQKEGTGKTETRQTSLHRRQTITAPQLRTNRHGSRNATRIRLNFQHGTRPQT